MMSALKVKLTTYFSIMQTKLPSFDTVILVTGRAFDPQNAGIPMAICFEDK